MIYTQSVLTLHLSNLKENYSYLKGLASHSIAAGIVKNDAYGLGIERVVPVLLQEGCQHFFVAHACEGVRVRRLAPNVQIYVLQGIGNDSLSDFISAHLTPVISTPAELVFWKQNEIESIFPILNVETGLNRLGFRLSDMKQLDDTDKKRFSFVMSHLACADEREHFMNQKQLKAFELMRSFVPDLPASLSASDGVFLGRAYQKDMVRLGAAVYGLNTAPYRPNKMKPVMSLKAPVLQIVDVPQGDYIGYGASYRAVKDMRIAIVSIGYGDGLPRSLGRRGRFFWGREELPFTGRLSMDNVMCDVTGISTLKEGDFVDVLNSFYTPDDMGADAGTIGYEILNEIGKAGRLRILED